MAETGSIINFKYEILKEVGSGGMSKVYLAIDRNLNKQWAVKEIQKDVHSKKNNIAIQSLIKEANIMKRLDHPALPRIVDIIDDGQAVFIIMDFIEGESMNKVIRKYGPQNEEDVISWAIQLCDALMYLHSQNPPIIYRDMKPANIMLKPDGSVKIIDFGISREYKDISSTETSILGTKGYAPPEQYTGETDVRSDIYSLGMTMYHMLTGADPGKTDCRKKIRQYISELSEETEKIIDKCTQPLRENRYQNCEELMYDLEHPETITASYRKKLIFKIRIYRFFVLMSAIGISAAVILRINAINIKNNSYESYISTATAASIEEKTDKYINAIEIYPERPEAYIKMLEAFEDGGCFSKKESDIFLSLYDKNKNKFDYRDIETLYLNYRAGMMYFNYYSEDDNYDNFRDRIQKSYYFFEENFKNGTEEFQYQKLSDFYYYIALFYKKYIFQSSFVNEASKQDYLQILDMAENIINEIDAITEANVYDKFNVYNGIVILIYDRRTDFAQAGISERRILNIIDTINENTVGTNVNKEKTKRLKEEILDNCKAYREALIRAYDIYNSKE